jgi:uncharacterized membrane protein YedE/YeeE
VIGIALGAVARVSNFCSVGAVSDVMLARDTRRLRSWIMAAAVALLGTQILVAMDVFSVNRTVYRVPEIDWGPVGVGGIAFGFGMAQAGGCIQRALVRVGGGSIRSLATLLLVAFSATATIRFLTADGVVAKWGGHTLVHAHGLDEALAATGIPPAASGLLLAVVVSGALIVFCLKDRWFRDSRSHLWGGAGIGLAVVAAWATARFQPFPKGVNLVIAAADTVTPFSTPFAYVGFSVGLVAGMAAGAFAVAVYEKDLMLDRFVDNADIKRHVVGGILMGFGGALAQGCSFGQGLSGFSVLSFNAVIAIAAMVLGCVWGIRALEAGSAWGGLKLCFGRKAS